MMNIDVTALQTVPELAAAPDGLKPKQCKTATNIKCGFFVTCEVTKLVVS